MLSRSQPSTFRQLTELAWPIAASMAGETVIGLVDAKLVAGLGARALGGVGVATVFVFLGYSIVFGILRGVKVRTAYAVGRGEPADGLAYAKAGIAIGVASGVMIWLLARDISPVLVAVGIDAELVSPARDFFAAVSFGAPAASVVSALTQHRQAIGDSRTPMFVTIGGNVVNVVLAYSLIYGHLGLPALGVRGAGFGTAITQWLEAFAMLALYARDVRRVRAPSALSLRRALRDVLSLGVPTGVQFGLELLAFTTFTAVLGSINAKEIAAHQLALATIRTSFLPGIAVGEAACVLVGQSLAQRKLDEADRVTYAALALAVGFMAAMGIVFGAFGGKIARAFTSDTDVASIVQRLLWVAALFQVLDAANIVLRGALRGAKDVRVPALLGIGIAWSCIPTAAYLLGKLAGWGALGGWCGFIAETTLAASLFWWRWRRGAWRAQYLAPAAESPAPLLGAPVAN